MKPNPNPKLNQNQTARALERMAIHTISITSTQSSLSCFLLEVYISEGGGGCAIFVSPAARRVTASSHTCAGEEEK